MLQLTMANLVFMALIALVVAEVPIPGDYLGQFELSEHEVQGDVYALNSDTLYVHRFYYDGSAPPGVHFRVLRAGERDLAKAEVITAIPELEDGRNLEGRTFNRDFTLHLPMKLSQASRLLVWCEQFGVSFGQLDLSKARQSPPQRPPTLIEVGKLIETEHAVHGRVFKMGSHALVVRDFNFDGRGPKAHFLIGLQGKVGDSGSVAVQLANQRRSRLGVRALPRVRQRDVRIQLPKDINTNDIRWMAVWCDTFDVSFGHVYFE